MNVPRLTVCLMVMVMVIGLRSLLYAQPHDAAQALVEVLPNDSAYSLYSAAVIEDSTPKTFDQPARPDPNNPRQLTPTRTPTPVNIGNFVWNDRNSNGIQNIGELGVAGVVVQLWNPTKTALFATTTTDTDGFYTLVAPKPDNYRIRVIRPSGFAGFSPKDQGTDDLVDSDINPSGVDAGFSDTFTIPSNVISTTRWDAGLVLPPTPTRTPTPVNIGNWIWHDLNGNGIQDTGEPGVGGVVVQLWNTTKTELLYSTTSDANGEYTVIAPRPDSYRIRVLRPSGATFTLKHQGGDELLDSDINPSGVDAGFSDVFIIPSNVISTTRWDAGLRNVQPSPTPTGTLTPPATTPTNTPVVTPPNVPPIYRRHLPFVLK